MKNYSATGDIDPFHLFRQWYLQAVDSDISDPTIMSLATAGKDGKPSVRIVLLKDFDERGFVFHTNYGSRKAREIESNPHAAAVIHWHRLGQQVRIEGRIEKIPAEESDRYFRSRPRGSQIGAWASEQSRRTDSREHLEAAFKKQKKEFEGKEISRPPFWGGYRLKPERMEFWSDREDRMHDRIVYEPAGGGWTASRLAP